MKTVIKKLLSLFNLELRKIDPSKREVSKHETYFGLLQKLIRDYNISYVFDVGASHGNWAAELISESITANIISFEPLKDSYKELKKRTDFHDNWECENYALGEADETASINVSESPECSSLKNISNTHLEAFPLSKVTEKQNVSVRSLDSFLEQRNDVSGNVFLKIDVQGHEKDVFDGCKKSLSRISLLQLEISLSTMYEKELLLTEWLGLLEEHKFYPLHFQNAFSHSKSHKLLQLDCIFVNGNLQN